jgi:YYY domain-containing protein
LLPGRSKATAHPPRFRSRRRLRSTIGLDAGRAELIVTVLQVVFFWAVVSSLGVVGVPFADLVFGRLPGFGRVFARPLALLVVAYPAWLLASTHLVPYGRTVVLVSMGAFAATGAVLWRRRPERASGHRSIWIAGESVFGATFFGWLLMRSFSPDVWQTEKPMDMALINVINRGGFFPPHDPWLAGSHVNYYYFGHYLVAFLIRLTGIDPAVGFNLGVALFYALTAAAVFGVAATLYASFRRAEAARHASSVAVGLTATTLAMVVGNLAGTTQLLHHASRLGTYDWWSPSRVIPGTANEFPFFSFLLGDLHAHVMATPFALLAVAYALQLATRGPAVRARQPLAYVAELALASLALGSLYAINSLDFPTAIAILLASVLVWILAGAGRGRSTLISGGAILGGGILFFLPFWLAFSPPTHGIALVREHARFTRFASDNLLLFGIPLWSVPIVFAGRWKPPLRHLVWAGSVALFVLVLLAPPRLAGLAVALSLAAAAAFAVFSSGRIAPPQRFLWLLLATGLGLVALAELFYIRDVFDGTASFRFNTVFKTGYQAWFLFAIVAAVGAFWASDWLGRRAYTVWVAGFAGLMALGFAYPVFASYSRAQGFDHAPTLDGMRWLERKSPGDAAAIDWLRGSVKGSPTVLETYGRDFDPDGRGRVSTFTGLPSVIEWTGHELQWGHDPTTRAGDAKRIYRTLDRRVALRLLRRYRVRYVFVGSLERLDYSAAELRKFSRLGAVAFRSRGTLVYRVAIR